MLSRSSHTPRVLAAYDRAMSTPERIACVGCAALVEDIDGPTHAYVGASPGCWAVFAATQAERSGASDPVTGPSATDAYMVQHPGVPERRSSQSVWVHLVGLCLAIEHRMPAAARHRAMQRMLSRGEVFEWLTPPTSMGPLTILDVRAAKPGPEQAAVVDAWGRSAWAAWRNQHVRIRARAAELLRD
jgi:hypothetical protein